MRAGGLRPMVKRGRQVFGNRLFLERSLNAIAQGRAQPHQGLGFLEV